LQDWKWRDTFVNTVLNKAVLVNTGNRYILQSITGKSGTEF
jgi:hypothetical protein